MKKIFKCLQTVNVCLRILKWQNTNILPNVLVLVFTDYYCYLFPIICGWTLASINGKILVGWHSVLKTYFVKSILCSDMGAWTNYKYFKVSSSQKLSIRSSGRRFVCLTSGHEPYPKEVFEYLLIAAKISHAHSWYIGLPVTWYSTNILSAVSGRRM